MNPLPPLLETYEDARLLLEAKGWGIAKAAEHLSELPGMARFHISHTKLSKKTTPGADNPIEPEVAAAVEGDPILSPVAGGQRACSAAAHECPTRSRRVRHWLRAQEPPGWAISRVGSHHPVHHLRPMHPQEEAPAPQPRETGASFLSGGQRFEPATPSLGRSCEVPWFRQLGGSAGVQDAH
jgi:hypothetical protein